MVYVYHASVNRISVRGLQSRFGDKLFRLLSGMSAYAYAYVTGLQFYKGYVNVLISFLIRGYIYIYKHLHSILLLYTSTCVYQVLRTVPVQDFLPLL